MPNLSLTDNNCFSYILNQYIRFVHIRFRIYDYFVRWNYDASRSDFPSNSNWDYLQLKNKIVSLGSTSTNNRKKKIYLPQSFVTSHF